MTRYFMDFAQLKKIHCIGIGGIGVSAVAKMFLLQRKKVSGSDLASSEITRELEQMGAKIFYNHQAENVPQDADLVIYTPAAEPEHIERQQAQKCEIAQLSYPQILGEISRQKYTIAVSGTNGKSTTTAMLGLILEKAGWDPMVIVGSRVGPFNSNFRPGYSKYFVVEACEHQANMLNLSPQVIVLTNIEPDHLDYYRDIEHIRQTFQEYINKLPADGILIINADDPVSQKLILPSCRVVKYGIENNAEVRGRERETGAGYQTFFIQDEKIQLAVPGLFNVYNTLAAAAAALALGLDLKIIQETLSVFPGIWRRFEKIGERSGAIIISDYAHHPTSVAATIKAAKEFFPGRRVMVVFQPHHHNRTKKLFNEFAQSFNGADVVILSEIYDVAGREGEADRDVSSRELVKAIAKEHTFYAKDLEETKKLILENLQSNDVVLIMGAGDIYKICGELIN